MQSAFIQPRIMRVMAEQLAHNLNLSPEAPVGSSGRASYGCAGNGRVMHATQAQAQPASKTGIEDTWQGTYIFQEGKSFAPRRDQKVTNIYINEEILYRLK
jgi:hypothetical protein